MSGAAVQDLLQDASIEMTAMDAPVLTEAAAILSAGSRVNLTFLGGETLEMRLAAVDALIGAGLQPVPHIAARRTESREQLVEYLDALDARGAARRILLVAGDPPAPRGPFADSLDLVATGLLPDHGVREVSFAGYPEGHPDISEDVLWRSLIDKLASARDQGLSASVVTQFGFDTDPVLRWIERARGAGVESEIRIGVPGPAGIRRLLAFAARFGVSSSMSVARKYGFSLANLLGTAGPDRFLSVVADRLEPARHGDVRVHFYTFGGLTATASWIRDVREAP